VNPEASANSAISTLLDVMSDHVLHEHADSDLHCWDPSSKSYLTLSYANLVRQAYAVGQRLVDQGVKPKSPG